MRFPRSSGVLLHPTSLPGGFGIGDVGVEAFRFVDWLAEAGQSVWQVLPLGPTGFGDSPYQCFSAFAGNPLLVSLERLVEEGWLDGTELERAPSFPETHVDFGRVIPWKGAVLAGAAERFRTTADGARRATFDAWCSGHAGWLDDYALFRALKDRHGGAPWPEWPERERRADSARAHARGALERETFAHRFAQWAFFRQWGELRSHARSRGLAILGDAPIFVAHDSADVWARPELFSVAEDGRPSAVAGVPPDYFSEIGQLWGNPLYRWDAIAADGWRWWIERVRAQLEMVDRLRLDHFIGFTRAWEVPGDATDARKGRFVPGPGSALFDALGGALGALPIVAEDLGVVTPEVEALRDHYAFPGMRVLQFAFDHASGNVHLPHAHVPNAVVYTGTHDNATTTGWWADASQGTRHNAQRYLAREIHEPAWELIRAGMGSVGDGFVAPAQDLLALDDRARMNFPGRPSGNWSWRLPSGALDDALAQRVRDLTGIYGRLTS